MLSPWNWPNEHNIGRIVIDWNGGYFWLSSVVYLEKPQEVEMILQALVKGAFLGICSESP